MPKNLMFAGDVPGHVYEVKDKNGKLLGWFGLNAKISQKRDSIKADDLVDEEEGTHNNLSLLITGDEDADIDTKGITLSKPVYSFSSDQFFKKVSSKDKQASRKNRAAFQKETDKDDDKDSKKTKSKKEFQPPEGLEIPTINSEKSISKSDSVKEKGL